MPTLRTVVEQKVRQQVDVPVELVTLVVEKTPVARVIAIFQALDAQDRPDPTVALIRVELADDPSLKDPLLASLGTTLRTLILDALLPDTPFTRSLGVVGVAIRDAGMAILTRIQALRGG